MIESYNSSMYIKNYSVFIIHFDLIYLFFLRDKRDFKNFIFQFSLTDSPLIKLLLR